MNKNQKVINFITLLTCGLLWAIVLCGFTYTYDTNTPLGSDDPAEADDRMREIKSALQERLNVEHVFDLTGTEVSGANTGKHTDITCDSIVNGGALTNTGAFSVNTDKFTVAAATGNTAIEGTLDIASTIPITAMLDEDDMTSDSDTAVVSQQSIKAYIDAQIIANAKSLGSWVSNPSGYATSVTALTDGFVCAYVNSGSSQNLNGYTPTSTKRVHFKNIGEEIGTIHGSITMPVKKGDTWKVTGASTVYWIPLS